MRHELWIEDGGQTFCLAGPHGDQARAMLTTGARLVWEVEASCHLDAMSKYYQYMNWGEYTTQFPQQDAITYESLGWQ